MVRTPSFHCRGLGSIPGWGTKIPQAEWCGQEKKKKKICSSVTLTTLQMLNGHMWLVVTVLDREDYRIFLSLQKILLDSTGIDNV